MINTQAPPHWRRNFYLFLSGQLLSGITSMVVQYAIIWYLAERTGSASILSFATIAGMVPMVILSPFVGPLIDKWSKKTVLISSDAVVAFLAIILSAVALVRGEFPIVLVFIVITMRALAQTFQMPTVQSVMPTMVPTDELTRVNGQFGMMQSLIFIVSPALGAFLYSIVSMQWLILTDVIGFFIGAGLLLLVKLPTVSSTGEKVSLWKDTKEGFTQLHSNRGMWWITLIGALFMLLFMPGMSMYPLITIQYFGGTIGDAGVIEVVYSSFMLLGGLFIGIFGKNKNRILPMIISLILIGVVIGLGGFLPANRTGFYIFVVFNAIAGIATPFFSSLQMAMIQQSFEVEYLGRVMGMINALTSLAGPVGLIFAGPLAGEIGVEKVLLISGSGGIICGSLLLLFPLTRQYDKNLQKRIKSLTEKNNH